MNDMCMSVGKYMRFLKMNTLYKTTKYILIIYIYKYTHIQKQYTYKSTFIVYVKHTITLHDHCIHNVLNYNILLYTYTYTNIYIN